ncbi:hypothetical protein [Microvirga calopogonii]|uniref:hypothetical protein n=1 Tax=Microvirga calopogonii TaxID=2078013 RepID=UPI000E0CE5FB|nr:hypothetical protein [Microvirga calopogonii]
MATLLPFPARREHLWPSLRLYLRTTTAIWRDELAELSPFGAPEIGWRRSPAGMELVWLGVSEDSDRILVTVSGHWQPLRDPQRAITTILEEAEFEYEMLRPIEPWTLVVQLQDAALGLPPGGERWAGAPSPLQCRRNRLAPKGAAPCQPACSPWRGSTRPTPCSRCTGSGTRHR